MGTAPHTAVLELLSDIGLDDEALSGIDASSHLREDLELNSVETTDLQLALRSRYALVVNLWDRTDYTVGELAELVADSAGDR